MKFACSFPYIYFSLLQSKDRRCLCYVNASQYGGCWNTLNKDPQRGVCGPDYSYSITVVEKQKMIGCQPVCVTHTMRSHPKTLDHTDKLSCYSFNASQFYSKCMVQGVTQSLTNVAY